MRMVMVDDGSDGYLFINPMNVEYVKQSENGITGDVKMTSGYLIRTSILYSDLIKIIEQELTKPQGD